MYALKVIQYLPLKFTPRPKVLYIKAFERYVLSLSTKKMTINSIAKLCNIGWDCIKAIQKRHLKERYKNQATKKLPILVLMKFTVVLNQAL